MFLVVITDLPYGIQIQWTETNNWVPHPIISKKKIMYWFDFILIIIIIIINVDLLAIRFNLSMTHN